MKNFLNWLILAVIILFGFARFKSHQLPLADDIRAVDNDPIQQPLSDPPFTFTYADKSYTVEPVAAYEIWGLIVTHNNIAAFDDIYHDSSSVDIKDICLIWGDNVADDNFHKASFWSEPWSCHFQTDDREVYRKFVPEQLSNSHLLSGDPEVRDAIRSSRIGDQIHLKGRLINYCPVDRPDMKRKTSTIRTDDGNGACEVIFVDSFEILARSAELWNQIYRYSWWAIFLLIGLKCILFVRSAYRIYH